MESYLISCGILKRCRTLNTDKLEYLAIVVESEEAYHIPKAIELLQLLVDIGVKRACLYDAEEILKKPKESIIGKLDNAILFEYIKLGDSGKIQEEKNFTEAHMDEALRAVGCKGPEPDLLLVYGPARCHLGFPTCGTPEFHEPWFTYEIRLQVHNGAPKLWYINRCTGEIINSNRWLARFQSNSDNELQL